VATLGQGLDHIGVVKLDRMSSHWADTRSKNARTSSLSTHPVWHRPVNSGSLGV
jgi:hypothetical protein